MFTRIEHMRVVPFDVRWFAQLLGSTQGSSATLLPMLHANGEFASIVEALSKLPGQVGGRRKPGMEQPAARGRRPIPLAPGQRN